MIALGLCTAAGKKRTVGILFAQKSPPAGTGNRATGATQQQPELLDYAMTWSITIKDTLIYLFTSNHQ